MVSRQDLLKVFVRGDDEVVSAVMELATRALLIDTDDLEVRAIQGVVHLRGELERRRRAKRGQVRR